MYKRVLSEEDKLTIKERLQQGETYQAIASSYGITRERIRQIAKKFNLQGHGLKHRRAKQLEKYESKMKKKYGSFWKGDFLDKSDFMYACKEKFVSKKNAAKQTGIFWDLEFEDLEWPSKCPILDIELNYFTEGGRQENSVSFDRVIPEKGYIKDNVYICSWRANRIKNNGTVEEHRKIADFLEKLLQKIESPV